MLLKEKFLKKFGNDDENRDWKVIVNGRIARLALSGLLGSLHIYVIYLDPADKKQQADDIKLMGQCIDSRGTLDFRRRFQLCTPRARQVFEAVWDLVYWSRCSSF